MKGRCRTLVLLALAVFVANVAGGQQLDHPFAPGDTFSISHTPMNAKLVPVDCDAKKIPIHSYKHSGNEATFLIPDDSPTCTYEVMGTQIKVIKAGKPVAEAKAANGPPPKQTTPSTPK